VNAVIDRSRLANAAAIAMGLAFLAIGALSIAYRDFAMNWQPYPEGLVGREHWGLTSGITAVVGGGLMAPARTRSLGGLVLAAFLGLWVLGLHLPRVAPNPLDVSKLNGLAESLAMTAGAFLIWRETRDATDRDAFAGLAIRAFGLAGIVFGTAHFVHAEFTASMVPAWLPLRLELAYLTGAVHALTGLAMLVGYRQRTAAALEAAMMTSFVLLVHIPRIAADPGDRLELTMGCIAVALSSAAWSLAFSKSAGR
jgi:uncharacterized membrane protein YphA (DoxX/SURF4 family)